MRPPTNEPMAEAASAKIPNTTTATGHRFPDVGSLTISTTMLTSAPAGTATPTTRIVAFVGDLPTRREQPAANIAVPNITFVPIGSPRRCSSRFQRMAKNAAAAVTTKATASVDVPLREGLASVIAARNRERVYGPLAVAEGRGPCGESVSGSRPWRCADLQLALVFRF